MVETAPVHVVLATRIFLPEPAAASFRLAALVRGLVAGGAQVRVLTATVPHDAPELDMGATIERWPVRRDSSGYVRGYVQYLSFDVPLLFRLIRIRRPDVLVCEPPPTTGAVVRLVAAVRRVPYVYYAADLWGDAAASAGMPGVVVRVLRMIERWAMKGAAAVIAVSDPVSDRVAELGITRVSTVANGVDTTVFSPDGNLVEHAPFLLYAGTASEWQGADVFVRAMPQVLEQLPTARLAFLGQGSDWPRLEQLADGLPEGAVTFLPRASAEDAARWQRSAAACLASIVPGQGYDLAYPTKINAALACGTPVVYAGPGPAVDVINTNHLGWAATYDVDDVARAMIEALRTPRAAGERRRRAEWVRDHMSAEVTGRKAAQIVLDASS